MPNFFNNLSIRNKLIVLIGGTVSLLTASVLTMVWMQSLKQARAIVQEQLDTSRQLFDSAQQARYRSAAFETASTAAQANMIALFERRDREAACAEVARLMKEDIHSRRPFRFAAAAQWRASRAQDPRASGVRPADHVVATSRHP